MMKTVLKLLMITNLWIISSRLSTTTMLITPLLKPSPSGRISKQGLDRLKLSTHTSFPELNLCIITLTFTTTDIRLERDL